MHSKQYRSTRTKLKIYRIVVEASSMKTTGSLYVIERMDVWGGVEKISGFLGIRVVVIVKNVKMSTISIWNPVYWIVG